MTKTSVKIGSHQPLTGPAAPGYSEIAPASKALFAYLNAHGKVNGRTINYVYKDDAYNPTQTVNVVKQLVLQDKVFAIFDGLGTPTHTKVLGFVNAEKVGGLFSLSGFAQDELRGQNFGVARLGYLHRLGRAFYLGGYGEAGRAAVTTSDIVINPILALTAVAAYDTPLGPLYLGYGVAQGSHRQLYLLFGRSF